MQKAEKRQFSLFDNIGSNQCITFNELKLEQMLIDLKKYIENKVINTSDTYFNIAYHRDPIITHDEKTGLYSLRFAQSSDSERLLSAYESNMNIEPIKLLGVGVAKGALTSIKSYIDDNPGITTKEVLEHFKIFNYPTYKWTHAQSTSLNEINFVKKLIIDWAILKEEMQLDLFEGKFTFMRTNKRAKTGDQTNVIPQCFDGMCLEQNFMKMIRQVQAD